MTEIMELELAPHITLNLVALGQILELHNVSNPQRFMENYANKNIPLEIFGNTNMVIDSVLFLLQQDFITGSRIRLQVGWGEYI